ncbi:unnamed protein product [Effrenium voratum]|nr:unnamed protein product [Effrenium voratum]
MKVALEQSGSAAQDLFNGVTTHYLSECPGRGFKNIGAVCVPNLHAMNAFPLQVLSRMAAINDTVWGSELQCLNAVCEMVPRWTCYERWVEWVLNGNNSAAGMLPNLQSTMVNDAPITPASLAFNGELIHGYMDLNKSREQLMVSDPVELQTENATLEAWIRLGQVEEIKNMVLQVPAYPNSEWSEDYLPKFACDGILTTYWSSQVGIRGIQTHEASLWLDLDGFQNGGAARGPFAATESSLPRPTPQSARGFTSALARCGKQSAWQQACDLLASMAKVEVKPDVFSLNATISACDRAREWQQAVGLFAAIPSARLARNVVSFNATVSACGRASQWQQAVDLFWAGEGALDVDAVGVCAAMSAYKKGSQWQSALGLFQRMPHWRLGPNLMSHNLSISALAKVGKWQHALGLLMALKDTEVPGDGFDARETGMRHAFFESGGFLQPDIITMSAVISACEKDAQWQHALSLFHSMPFIRVRSNVVSFNAAISACEKASQWQQGLARFQAMPLARVSPDVITLGAVISACEKDGQWQHALSLLWSMPTRSVQANVVSFNAAISACEKGSQWQYALAVLMAMSSLVRDAISFNAAISACEKGGQWKLALGLLQAMPAAQVAPDVVSLSASISACRKVMQWQQALHLFASMHGFGIRPNVVSFNAAISACAKASWQHALALFTAMPLEEVAPNVVTFTAAITACVETDEDAWEKALELLAAMWSHKVQPNVVTFAAAISSCERAAQWPQALGLLAMAPLDAVCVKAAAAACERGQQWQRALSLAAPAVIIYWKEPASDYSVSVSLDNLTWWTIIEVQGNQDTYNFHEAFFGAKFLKLHMTRAAATRGPGIDEGKPVFSIYELEVERDTNVARLKTTTIFNFFEKPPESAIDGDLETSWMTAIGSPSAEFYVDLGTTVKVMATKLSWRFRPGSVKVFVGPNPCSAGVPTEQFLSLSSGLVLDFFEVTANWEGQCMVVVIEETRTFFGEQYVGIREVEFYTDSDDLAPNGTINSSFPDQVHHLTDVSNCLDGNPATYWLLQPQEDPTTVTVDLGAIFQIMSIEIRFASVDGEDYFASRFYTEMGTELVSWEMFEVDAQQGSRTMSHYFQVYRLGRYVRFVFEQVFGLNPEGRLGIEDFVIRKVSDNLARRSGVTVSASSSWVEAEPIIYDGNLRPHDGAFAVDDNFDTWFGAAYGLTDFANAFLQVTFPSLVLVDIAAVRWKYPASEIFGLCSAGLEGEDFSTVANVDKNTAYVTPVVFYSSYACRRVRVTLGPNMGTFGQQPVIAIREIEVYSTQEDITLNRPVSANDGSVAAFATDDSDVTVWSSLSLNETWLTIDTESNFSAWGARILSPSTSIIDAFDIQVSDDGDVFDTVYTVQSNLNNDLWVIQRFSGRYVRFVFKVSLANAFYVRTIRIFATPNLALGQETYAPYRWDHSGVEAVDGLNETIWLSEPLATRANVRLDLGEQTFIAGGMELFWLYPPTDFGIFLSNDTVSWEVLWSTTGNYNYATVIGCPDLCYWESQYIEIRMTRASPDNGDGLYALKSFNVYFDTNLAHFKPITATKTMPGNPFAPENAIDGDESSFWMPAQRASNSYITFDMTYDVLICGFTVNWVRPPVQYYVEYEEADTFIWKFVNRWVTWGGFANVGYQQEWFDGFPARRLRVTIEEKHLLPEGRVSALADVHLNVWERSENLALNRQVIPSEETILGNLASNAVDGNERGTYWYPAEGSPQAWIIVQLDPIAPVPGVPPQGHPVGRIVVVWRFPPGDLTLERQMNQEWLMLAQWTDYMELITDWAGMRSANAIRLNIDKSNTVCDPPDPFCQEIGILEIKVYKYAYSLPNAVEPDVNPWSAVPEYMVDPDKACVQGWGPAARKGT